jgi:hypothetical protein
VHTSYHVVEMGRGRCARPRKPRNAREMRKVLPLQVAETAPNRPPGPTPRLNVDQDSSENARIRRVASAQRTYAAPPEAFGAGQLCVPSLCARGVAAIAKSPRVVLMSA